MDLSELQRLDLAHIWHPCAQMKDYETLPPVEVVRASGSLLYTADGRTLIDGNSSWWCKSLGHGHPKIKAAVRDQLDRFEHIIAANTCSPILTRLSVRLATLFPGLDRCFYADNGSTAVEIALKMALQYQQQTGQKQRTDLISLQNGYHGETLFTLSVGDCEIYSEAYRAWTHKIPKLFALPYVADDSDPRWHNMGDEAWNVIEQQLAPYADTLAAIIFEPIVQGAGGMLVYSPDFLRRLRKWCTDHRVMMTADEIMTGFGRTGRLFASEHAGIVPDLVCLSKGLTSGYAPMSAVLCSTKTYSAFYDDFLSRKAFLHSNTYTGYAVGAAAALAALTAYEEEKTIESVAKRGPELLKRMAWIAKETGALANVRGCGFVTGADIVDPSTGLPFDPKERRGYEFFKAAVQEGAMIRPLLDTIYFLPPLNTPDEQLDQLAEITVKAIRKAIASKS